MLFLTLRYHLDSDDCTDGRILVAIHQPGRGSGGSIAA